MSTLSYKRASLAREYLRLEGKKIAKELRDLDDSTRMYLVREEAQFRKVLKQRATVVAMTISLFNCRVHAHSLRIENEPLYFRNLQAQAFFLESLAQAPFSCLNRKLRYCVQNVVEAFYEQEEYAEERFLNYCETQESKRRLTKKREWELLTLERAPAKQLVQVTESLAVKAESGLN